jgi:putative transposase
MDKFAFENLKDARIYSQAWIWMYHNERPHQSPMKPTPTAFLLKYGKLHHPHKHQAEFPTFQQGDYDWNSIVLFDAK